MALGGKHTLPGFEQALESLRTDGALMGALVSRSVTNAKLGFTQRDDDYCAAVIADDEEVDILQKQVDRGGTGVLLRFTPMAFDLRSVLAMIRLSSHLENLSDQAVVIARRVRSLNSEIAFEDEQLVAPIFDLAENALFEALTAFSQVDSPRAERVRSQMAPLAQSSRELEEQFSDAVGEHPERARAYVNLIAITRSLEHIVNLVKNIAEEVIYMAEAKDVRHAGNRLAEEE